MFPYVPVFLFFFLKVSCLLEAHQGVDHASAGKGQKNERNKEKTVYVIVQLQNQQVESILPPSA